MKRPNILVFMTDQQRGDSIFTGTQAKMPNLERFRSEGLTFTHAYTVAPHCCPARATFFSGLYPSQHGVWNNVRFNNALTRGFYDGVRLFSEDLCEHYRMLFSGKWHASDMETPLHRGFDEFSEPVPQLGKRVTYYMGEIEKRQYCHTQPPTTNWKLYDSFVQRDRASRLPGEIIRQGYPPYYLYGEQDDLFQDQDVVDNAIKMLEKNSSGDKPWFCYIGTLGPHDPYFVPQKYLDMYSIDDLKLPDNFVDKMKDKPAMYRRIRDLFDQLGENEHREALRHYLAFCTFQDALFGQVLDWLDKSGQAEDTLVIFLSDHGDYAGEHGLWCKGLACFEGAYHIPLVMRWLGGIENPGRTVDSFVTLADFAPTFLEISRITSNTVFAGRSLVPLLKEKPPEDWVNELYTQTNGNELYGIQRSVRTQEWKYVFNGFDYDELYDLQSDPGETVNLIGDVSKQPIVKELCKKLWTFAFKNDDVCVHPYIFCGLASYGPGIICGEEHAETSLNHSKETI